jgi:hypothetical protein
MRPAGAAGLLPSDEFPVESSDIERKVVLVIRHLDEIRNVCAVLQLGVFSRR